MRKKDETLRENILSCARDIVNTQGPDAINIRSIANKTGIATGTVYNYFSCKDDILIALTEEYWRNTLAEMRNTIRANSFCEQLREIYTFILERIDQSAGMLMRSLSNIEGAGRARMNAMHSALGNALVRLIDQDENILNDIWNETFTKEQYTRFVIINMMALLQAGTLDISFFLEIVRKTIY